MAALLAVTITTCHIRLQLVVTDLALMLRGVAQDGPGAQYDVGAVQEAHAQGRLAAETSKAHAREWHPMQPSLAALKQTQRINKSC